MGTVAITDGTTITVTVKDSYDPKFLGLIGINGAAARKGLPGDLVIIVSYALYAPEELAGYKPRIVVLDKGNQIKNVMHVEEAQHPYRG